MNRFKKSPMALALIGLGAASSFAEIKLSDNLTTSGFIDMSALGTAPKEGDATLDANFDQFEMDLMYTYGMLSARTDLAQGGVGGGDGALAVEQAYLSIASGGASVTFGKFLSASGFETAEPTGLYQYSYSKTVFTYGGYQTGLALAYNTPMFGVYGSVVTDVWGSNNDLLTPGFEVQLSVTPLEGFVAKAAFLTQMYDDSTGLDNQNLLNIWAMYATGPITVAAEYNMLMNWVDAGGQNGNGWLAMVNYKITPLAAATIRYSGIMFEDAEDPDTEITFSPSFAIHANLLAVAEVKYNIDMESTDYALEALFSF